MPSAATVLPGAEMTRSNPENVSGRRWTDLVFIPVSPQPELLVMWQRIFAAEPRLFSHLSSGACPNLSRHGTNGHRQSRVGSLPRLYRDAVSRGSARREDRRSLNRGHLPTLLFRSCPILDRLVDSLSPAELESTSLIREEISSRLNTSSNWAWVFHAGSGSEHSVGWRNIAD